MDESKDTWTTLLGVVENAWTTLEVLTSTYGVVQVCLFRAKTYTELTGIVKPIQSYRRWCLDNSLRPRTELSNYASSELRSRVNWASLSLCSIPSIVLGQLSKFLRSIYIERAMRIFWILRLIGKYSRILNPRVRNSRSIWYHLVVQQYIILVQS